MNGSQRVVIAGGGRVGSLTAEHLDNRGDTVTVIETDQATADGISDDYVATVIVGDATRPDILRQADIDRADAVAALTGKTGTNIAICMLAERLADDVRTVLRTDRRVGDEYAAFVDEVIFPEAAGARAATNAIDHGVATLADASGTVDIMEIQVTDSAPVAGRSLSEVAFPQGSLVVSDIDGDKIARSDTVLEPGRTYVVAVEPDLADEVLNLMRGG